LFVVERKKKVEPGVFEPLAARKKEEKKNLIGWMNGEE